MATKLPSPSDRFLHRFLLKYSIMNAQLQRICKTAKTVHTAFCEGFFFFLFMSGALFQTIMWMLSLATGQLSHMFIKKLEWQYLGAVHREAYNTKQLLFCWNHYWVLGWDTSGQCFEDHWWIMTKWVFTETIGASSCTFAQELQVGSSGRNLLTCHLGLLSHWLWHKIEQPCPC